MTNALAQPLESEEEIDRLLAEVMVPPELKHDREEDGDDLHTIRVFLEKAQRYSINLEQEEERKGTEMSNSDLERRFKHKQEQFLKKKHQEDMAKTQVQAEAQISRINEEEKEGFMMMSNESTIDDVDIILQSSTNLKRLESEHEERKDILLGLK